MHRELINLKSCTVCFVCTCPLSETGSCLGCGVMVPPLVNFKLIFIMGSKTDAQCAAMTLSLLVLRLLVICGVRPIRQVVAVHLSCNCDFGGDVTVCIFTQCRWMPCSHSKSYSSSQLHTLIATQSRNHTHVDRHETEVLEILVHVDLPCVHASVFEKISGVGVCTSVSDI